MTIAVLMSTYNGEKYIREQIDSILAQEGCSITLLVRDDGSTDSTVSILETYKAEGKLDWYTGRNLGPAKSFLDLLMHSGTADYYAFSDQDDIWDPDKLAIAADCLQDIPGPAFYCSNSRLVDGNGEYLGRLCDKRAVPEVRHLKSLLTSLCGVGGVVGCTMVMNHPLVQTVRNCGVPSNVIMHDVLMRQICHCIGGTILFDGRPHMGYRQHGANVIGVRLDFAGKIRSRLEYAFRKKKVMVEDTMAEILALYGEELPPENLPEIWRVANYRKSIFTRLSLACSWKLKDVYVIPGIWDRLSLLWGNR